MTIEGGFIVQAELVKSLEAFRNLNDQQVASIQEHCEILEYGKGDKLFSEGDEATHLWIVKQGVIDLRFELPDGRPASSKHTISSVDVKHQDPEAQVLGWSCFISPYKMQLSAYCVTDVAKIIRIEKS